MAMQFRDPEDLTKYQDMHDQIHLDEKSKKTKALCQTQITYHKGDVPVCCCKATI